MGIVAALIAIGALSAGQIDPLPHLDSITEQLRAPARIAIAPNGSFLVTDPVNRHIVLFDSNGKFSDTRSLSFAPVGVAVHPDGRVFVSFPSPPGVAVYDSSFAFQEYLGEADPLVSYAGPTDIDIATDTGRIYVVDSEGDRVYVFEQDGSLALILGLRGQWPGQFIYPSAIAVDEGHGRVIIADHDKWRVQIFTTSGVLLQQFGDRKVSTPSGTAGWMPRPSGLDVDAYGNIYLTDALMGTVRVFDSSGAEIGKVAEYGYEPGGLRIPTDLALSGNGSRLYVASTNSSSIEVYDTMAGLTQGMAGVDARDKDTLSLTSEPVAESTPRKHARAGGRGSGSLPSQGGLLPKADPTRAWNPDGPLETGWNGPHIVEDRPNICWPCHGLTGQPGTHAGTVEGQSVLCMSCHNAAGRGLTMIIHESDIADPYGTNPNAYDGRGRSHAWGVPVVNPQAGSLGPDPGSPMLSYLDNDGNMKCSTCHNQHDIDYGPYLRVDNTGDAMCKECHLPFTRGLAEGGSHPVGFLYPAGEDEYPPSGEITPLVIKDGMVECLTCHAPHGADSGGANDGDGDGMLLRDANDQTLCQICHVDHTIHFTSTEWQPTCSDCHDMHDADNQNAGLIAAEIEGVAVTYVKGDAACNEFGSSIHSVCDPPSYDGLCEVCHTETEYHLNSSMGDHVHYLDVPCLDCHSHSGGFLVPEDYCKICHGDPPDGTESPNRAGTHATHLTAVNGPNLLDCYDCHPSEDDDTHDDGTVSFISGVDANGDGHIDLAETDTCDECHGATGPVNGVNDPVIGAKENWDDGVYDGDVLKPDKLNWCAGCHDDDVEPAEVNGVDAPPVSGDNRTWGAAIIGHGFHDVACTDCHDPTLTHTDGVAKTFSTRFPLRPGGTPKPPAERELDKEVYNDGYRLRRINGQRALEVPRDSAPYNREEFQLCFECHEELQLMGVPANYNAEPRPPAYLQMPLGVAQTNYRNDNAWGFNWFGRPGNAHWYHTGLGLIWDIDHDNFTSDSSPSCVTCHNPHGTLNAQGVPTIAMTPADLDIGYGVYDDGNTTWDYGYIGSGGFYRVGGDLHCLTCHPWHGEGEDPPTWPDSHTRYFRMWLDLSVEDRREGDR